MRDGTMTTAHVLHRLESAARRLTHQSVQTAAHVLPPMTGRSQIRGSASASCRRFCRGFQQTRGFRSVPTVRPPRKTLGPCWPTPAIAHNWATTYKIVFKRP